MSSGAMQSKAGNPQVYNDGDQRNPPKTHDEIRDSRESAFHEGKPNAHNNLDSKDARSLGNRLAAVEHDERFGFGEELNKNNNYTVEDPLKPARDQGHEPSRGAKIDKQLQEEEDEYLQRKGKA
ncbi:hypothetical protein FA95DRAFT_1605626 [Auriscalpium vulgare]|uniref:Uncharacterized protein n=1 Tax=Auriscalpium vulgare TaxID=40419 RepID=A0ACB8RWI9_9AGAM|nr:hypothetical protein FA95DRAFT_1605626 [Auriscalpium vulgare]